MNRLLCLTTVLVSLIAVPACQQSSTPEASPPTTLTAADLAAMAEAVPTGGPREGNNYKFFFLVLRQDQRPAAGFKVDAWVKGKSEPKTIVTDEAGLARFEDLPFPDAKHPLETILHYNAGKGDTDREITYPYIESDAYRLKDIQYIPNTATP